MVTLYRAGRQQLKVRGIMLLALACAVWSVWAGVVLAQTYGLNPGDGGVLAPLTQRLAWGIGVGLLGPVFAAGMWIYGRIYAAEIALDEQRQQLIIKTLTFFGTTPHQVPLSEITGTRFHRGTSNTLGMAPSVNAPWRSISIAGRRLPLILDLQGEVLDQALFDTFFGQRRRTRGREVR